MSSGAALTTTSYAVLGLLALRPWTTYELIQQMERSLWRLWPRAPSRLYEEPKKLVAHGLATASREQVGRRARHVYTITPAGREALAGWLEEPARGPVLEAEQVLKLFFAEQGSKRAALARIREAREWAAARAAEDLALSEAYLAGAGQFPQRSAVLAVTGRFITEFAEMVARWADWAEEHVASWPEDLRDLAPDLSAFEEYVHRHEAGRDGRPSGG